MTIHLITAGTIFNPLVAGVTAFIPVAGNNLSKATEAHVEMRARNDWTLSDMLVRIGTNTVTLASTIRSRKNGANGSQSVSIPASTGGLFEDTTNNDSLATGDTFNTQAVIGSTGTHLFAIILSYLIEDTTDSRYPLMVDGVPFTRERAITSFVPLNGRLNLNATESSTQYRTRTPDTTFSNLRTFVTNNGISDASTLIFKDGGAPAGEGNQIVTVTASTTGEFEDTTNNDQPDTNELINYEFATGMGSHTDGNLTVTLITCIGDDANMLQVCGGLLFSLGAGNTRFNSFGTDIFAAATTEVSTAVKQRNPYDLSNMFIRVLSNAADGATTVAARKNGVNSALSISIPSSTNGEFENTSDVVSLATNDEANWIWDSAASSGTLAVNIAGIQSSEPSTTILAYGFWF